MIEIIDGIEYVSVDFAGVPVHYIVNKNWHNQDNLIHIVGDIDGIPVQSIKDGAFFNSQHLQEIELPDSLFRIGRAAFQGCTELKTIRFYNTSAKNAKDSFSVGAEAFSGCVSLVNIETVKPLHLNGRMIFHDCIALEKLNEGNLLVGGIYAFDFYNCQNLKNIHIKGKRCRLWTNCFKETNNIESVTFDCEHVQIPKSVLRKIIKRKIYCHKNCNLADLAYTGANVEIID